MQVLGVGNKTSSMIAVASGGTFLGTRMPSNLAICIDNYLAWLGSSQFKPWFVSSITVWQLGQWLEANIFHQNMFFPIGSQLVSHLVLHSC